MKKDNLKKYMNGGLSEAEQLEVQHWIEKNGSNSRASEQDFAEFLHRYPSVENEMRGNSGMSGKSGIKCRCLKGRHYIAAASIAAAIALFIIIGISFHQEGSNGRKYRTIANNTEEILFSHLPDGSSIALSPKSKVCYHKQFGKTHRKVYFKGSCWFNVAKNKEIPFKVKASGKNIMIEVTGTKFYTSTICDSTRSEQFELSLTEGSVNVKTCSKGVKQQIQLSPGDHLDITKDYTPVKSAILDHPFHPMHEMVEYLNFKEAKLRDITKRLEKVHNCKFKITNKEAADHLLTANFADNSLDDILLIFEVTMNVRSTKTEDGTIELR